MSDPVGGAAPGRGGPQVIPRPAQARLLPGNPWRSAFAQATPDLPTLERVLREDRSEPLGDRLRPPLLSTDRESAVLVPAYLGADGDVRVVLTRRSRHLRTHTGEVAFPGGRREAGESLEATALREAHEEIGLDPRLVRLVGRLEPLSTMRSASAITPIVGVIDDAAGGRLPPLVAHEGEVERIFDVGLHELVHDDCFRAEEWPFGDGWHPVYFFEVLGDTIWGATARILHRLLTIVADGLHGAGDARW